MILFLICLHNQVDRVEQLMKHIDALHMKYPCLGSRKLVNLLKGEHFSVGRKLVRRLMQAMGLYVVYPKPNLSKRDFRESIVPYLLKNKVVDFPNQVWSIDITYIRSDADICILPRLSTGSAENSWDGHYLTHLTQLRFLTQ